MYDKRIMGKVYLYNGILPQNGKWTTAIHQQKEWWSNARYKRICIILTMWSLRTGERA